MMPLHFNFSGLHFSFTCSYLGAWARLLFSTKFHAGSNGAQLTTRVISNEEFLSVTGDRLMHVRFEKFFIVPS